MMNSSVSAAISPKNLAPLPGISEPRWWTGVPALDPTRFTIDGSQFREGNAPLVPSDRLARKMQQVFDDVGLVHVVNTGLGTLQEMRLIASQVVKRERKYEGGANPRRALEKNVYEVGAPLQAWLHYHHEMAYIGSSTRMLAFLAYKMPREGGYTFVSDNLQATDAILATGFGEKLKALGLCYHRNLTDREAFTSRPELGVYNHWQQSMLTEDPDAAIAEARSRGLEAQWGPNRLLKTRYYISAFEYFPQLDRNLLFSSLADDSVWFDTWPMVQHLPADERPLKLTFGDGTEMTQEEKQLFLKVYDDAGIPIPWKVGDVAIVCNYRFAHGRPAVHLEEGEERELGVLIGEAFDRVQALDDKW
ncbi:MAG: TauD/TfdA family dioxygenase [Pseudomonadota bacterium]